MDEDLLDLVRTSVRQALESSPDDIGAALAEFGWAELAATDEAFAFTTLFEAQGALGADTDALDVVTAATVGIDGPVRIVWSLAATVGGDGTAGPRPVTGIALRPLGDASRPRAPSTATSRRSTSWRSTNRPRAAWPPARGGCACA